jgi:integrase
MVRLDSIDTKAIDDYIKVLRAKGNKPKTVNNKLNCLSSMLTLMTERQLLKALPVMHWESVKNNSRPRYFSPEEEMQILDLAGDMHFHAQWINELLQDFIILLADTGMRPWSEAKALDTRWIVSNSVGVRVIRIPQEVTKTDTEREIPITPRLAMVLDKHSLRLGTGGVVFEKLDYKWHCVEFWDNLVRPVMRWGKKEVWYCFRHTFATRLCEYHGNLKVVQSLMGHSCITQTARYAKSTDTAMSNAILALEVGRLAALEHSRAVPVYKSADKSSQTQPQTGGPNGLTH